MHVAWCGCPDLTLCDFPLQNFQLSENMSDCGKRGLCYRSVESGVHLWVIARTCSKKPGPPADEVGLCLPRDGS